MGERGETEADPPMDEVAKRLDFNTPGARSREKSKNNSHSSSPSQAAKIRDPLHGQHRGGGPQGKKRGSRRKGRKFGIGIMAALVVWLMCLACLGVMAWLNWDRWSELSMEGTKS